MRYSDNMNKGYNGWSMSNRAVDAYLNDEMPISRWTKRAILEKIDEFLENNTPKFSVEKLKKVKLSVLKKHLLSETGWHHTSKFCNVTYFYKVSEAVLLMTDDRDIDFWISLENAPKVVPVEEEKKEVVFSKKAMAWKKSVFMLDRSSSGNYYELFRKPRRSDYEEGLDKFFKIGENRINAEGKLERWNGKEFESAE